jgi:peptide-methionine (R)-S-oxide reductase
MADQKISRRHFLAAASVLALGISHSVKAFADKITKLVLSEKEWRMKLTEEQYDVLREEGTERPNSSPLNDEKRKGVYVCTGCDLPLFSSEMKFDSGTGWPSFFTHIEKAIETKLDFKILYPRTEYHCARCGGHQGHVFKDGPQPTGERWCNNGVALKFIPDEKV